MKQLLPIVIVIPKSTAEHGRSLVVQILQTIRAMLRVLAPLIALTNIHRMPSPKDPQTGYFVEVHDSSDAQAYL